jgi:undecaprenyl diphosphate synthase
MHNDSKNKGLHVAIIMDGNGRWAQSRGLPRTAGHVAGIKAVRRVVEAAPSRGVSMLTLYAFSADNWKRPRPEVRALMRLLERYLRTELVSCIRQGVRIEVLGRRDRLPARVVEAIETAERESADGAVLTLRLAVDYSSRDEIMGVMAEATRTKGTLEGHFGASLPRPLVDVDLVVRTGGEQRLSDFLLWESAYAELYFTEVAWPDFDEQSLAAALEEYGRRNRRFGGLQSVVKMSAAS